VRNIRYQEDLIDQHCNSSEKRLARILLLLAKKNTADSVVPKLDQTTLAQMVGTTRSRVSFFMNRFRLLGLIDYSDCRHGLQIHGSLLSLYARKDALALVQAVAVPRVVVVSRLHYLGNLAKTGLEGRIATVGRLDLVRLHR
jgi:hypothetical protein